MSPRIILRIFLVVILLVLVWLRGAGLSRGALIGIVVLALLLALGLVVQLTKKPRNLKDEVPKRPLGLE